MENNEFERSGSDVRKNKGSRPAGRLKRVFTVIAIAVITMALIFSVAGCGEEENKDDNATPGITVPETPADPSADTDDPSADTDDPSADEDDPVIDPDDPVIDPDDPVIDPDDPVIDPDPENPGEDIPPEDVPPEDVPPEDKPPEEENPGQEDPSTEIPGSIDEVDEVDEINYFADEFIERVNQNYGDALAKRMIGASATRENLANADWSISQGSERGISQIEVKTTYESGLDTIIRVGTITFDQEYSIQDILNGNAGSPIVARAYNASVETTNIDDNLDLGKTVIQTIDADNNLKGDIWCSIGSPTSIAGNTYREITVYQITDNGVQNFTIWALANGTSDPEVIKNNIKENKISGSGTQSTEYTFAGEKIK